MSMRLLLTCRSLSHRGGSEMHVRDLALALARRGHQVTVWSSEAGALTDELAGAGVQALAAALPEGPPPDLIHGHQYRELALALLCYPATPAVFTCHSARDEESTPWPLPAVRRAIAVDGATAERLAGAGFPATTIATVANAVDLARFLPRSPLPAAPRRALVFSNYVRDAAAEPIRAACAATGVALDLAGSESGRAHARPEELLDAYDVVFAKGRCALEAMAVGCAVIVCDAEGLGGLVQAAAVPALRAQNFGFRCLTRPLDAALIAGELACYSPGEAARVRDLIRSDADLESAVDATLAVYAAALAEADGAARADWRRGLAEPLAPLLAGAFERQRLSARSAAGELETARRETAALHHEAAAERLAEAAARARADEQLAQLRFALEQAGKVHARLADELASMGATRTWRLRDRLLRSEVIRSVWKAWVNRGRRTRDQS